ncbi:MAG: DnaJ domain-containing protein [Rickettsiales bacterium]|nr:DnaJ domain-containing protein [Rickettsiales bacterium]
MPRFKYLSEDDFKPEKQCCNFPGCEGHGEFKAPLSRDRLDEYQWLCDYHIKEFNKGWDYFKGMSQSEIEAFQKDAVTGHRPTWQTNEADKFTTAKLHDAVDRFMGGAGFNMKVQSINQRDKKALADLDLEHPAARDDIKKQYKKLVKEYHPDTNQGDKVAEERFKQITSSYNHLMQEYAASIN